MAQRIDFDMIKRSVSALDAAQEYGLALNRNNKGRCPWHSDKNPSLSFRDNYCFCFVCHKGGSCIDLAQVLLGVDAKEAAAMIARDFGLSCAVSDISEEKARELRAQREAAAAKAEAEKVARDERYDLLCEAVREADKRIDAMIAKDGREASDKDDFWKLLRKRALLDLLIDCEVGA